LQHYSKHGNCVVLESQNRLLSKWVWWQKQRRKQRTLTSSQKAQLDDLGFDWSTSQDSGSSEGHRKGEGWETRYQQLKEYYETHQTCEVPPTFGDSKLYQWVCSQKKAAKSGSMKEDRWNKLASLNFWETFPIGKLTKATSLGTSVTVVVYNASVS